MRKTFTNHSARKTTVGKLKKANIVLSDIASHRPQMKKLLNDYYEADEEERRPLSLANEIMRNESFVNEYCLALFNEIALFPSIL